MKNNENARKFLVSQLESFYSRKYPPAQGDEIVKRFAGLNDLQLVTLYDQLVGNFDRLPALSKIIECWEKSRNPSSHTSATSHGQFVNDRAGQAEKDADDYVRQFLQYELIAAEADQGRWLFELRKFVKGWALAQARSIHGCNGYGVSPEMVGWAQGDEYDCRLDEMNRSVGEAVAFRKMHVTVPGWFVTYARKQAEVMKRPDPNVGSGNLSKAINQVMVG